MEVTGENKASTQTAIINSVTNGKKNRRRIQIGQRGKQTSDLAKGINHGRNTNLINAIFLFLQHPIFVNCDHRTAVEADVGWRQSEGVGGLGGGHRHRQSNEGSEQRR